jgi:enoyl-CoA hydratase
MPPLRLDRLDDGIVVLTLDVPKRRNAMTEDLTAAWADAMRLLGGDTSLRFTGH